MRLTGAFPRDRAEALVERVMSLMAPAVVRTEVLSGGQELADEMRKHVPRETGELESEIVVKPLRSGPGQFVTGVGIPASSPAIHKARATEFGTWNYGVGTPESPKTRWPAKSKSGATMPWQRTSLIRRKSSIIRSWRNRIGLRLKRGKP